MRTVAANTKSPWPLHTSSFVVGLWLSLLFGSSAATAGTKLPSFVRQLKGLYPTGAERAQYDRLWNTSFGEQIQRLSGNGDPNRAAYPRRRRSLESLQRWEATVGPDASVTHGICNLVIGAEPTRAIARFGEHFYLWSYWNYGYTNAESRRAEQALADRGYDIPLLKRWGKASATGRFRCTRSRSW